MTQRPSVTVHYAQSVDGRIATATGDSQWIGGPASLRFAHQLRADHDAVLVGVGTAIADNPRLSVRLVEGRSPRRVVVDSTLRLPLDCHLLTDGGAETLVATTARAPAERVAAVGERGGRILTLGQNSEGSVNLEELLGCLHELGVRSVLVEGGGGIITSLLAGGLADRLTVCISPLVIGKGVEAVGDLGVRRLADALRFASVTFTPIEDDVLFEGALEVRR